jgi:ABC-type transport system involved in multi-copper enzyme maturation permease subunit
MGLVFLHQVHDNLKSLRFQLGLLVLLLFFAANGAIYALKGTRLAVEEARIRADDESRYTAAQSVRQAAGAWLKIHSPATGTEFVAEGGFDWLPDGMWISPASSQTVWTTTVRTTNHWMRRFQVLDWTSIARCVLSFLSLVLAYDAVSGERERGTLQLVLTHPLSRGRLLAGKLLAHLVSLMVGVAVGATVSLLILALAGVVELGVTTLASALLYLVEAAVFAGLFLLMGMGISALMAQSASSLVFLLTAWALLVVVVPQTSYLVAVRAVPSTGGWEERILQHDQEARAALVAQGLTARPPEAAAADGYAVEQRLLQGLQELERESDRLRREAEQLERRQYAVARAMNLLSPAYAFQYSTEALLGAGVQRYESFVAQGWRYRDELRQFLRARDTADPSSPHLLFLPDFMSSQPLDGRELPRFQQRPLAVTDSAAGAAVPTAILVLEAALAFFFALWAVNRMDLAGGAS